MKVRLEDVRLAFPELFTAKTVNGQGDPAFSATFLMQPDSPSVEVLNNAFEEIGKEKWGNKWVNVKKELETKDRLALHDGDAKSNYSGFPGNLYISARNKTRPLVIDRNKSPLTAQDGKPYAGCFVNASVELWAQDNNYGRRINATIKGVQFLRDGDSFTGGTSASEDDFDDVEISSEDLV
jgi:hypothetical protein